MNRLACFVVLALCACSSTGEDSHKPAAELATDKRDVVAAFRTGGSEWELMREEVRKQPALANFVVDNMVDQMLRSYNRAQVSTATTSDGPFERARAELVALSEYSSPVLVELIEADVSDAVVAFLAADVLRVIGDDTWSALMPKLDSKQAETRRRVLAVFAGMEFGSESDEKEVERLFERVRNLAHNDPEWIVRAEAAATLGPVGRGMSGSKAAREALIACLLDKDADVRGSAELAFGVLGDPRSFPVLVEALGREIEEGEPRNMAAARSSLITLARDAALEKRGRRLSIRDWHEYWLRHRERLLRRKAASEKR